MGFVKRAIAQGAVSMGSPLRLRRPPPPSVVGLSTLFPSRVLLSPRTSGEPGFHSRTLPSHQATRPDLPHLSPTADSPLTEACTSLSAPMFFAPTPSCASEDAPHPPLPRRMPPTEAGVAGLVPSAVPQCLCPWRARQPSPPSLMGFLAYST